MKAFDTLTVDELVALTRPQIELYVDLACAEQGIQLLPTEAPAPPTKDKIMPDLKLYTLGGLSFFDRKDAEKVRELLQKTRLAKLEYIRLDGYTTDYNRKEAVDEYEIPTIGEGEAFSPSYAGKHKTAIQAYNTAKEEYDAAKRTYDEISSKRVGIAKDFSAKIGDARKTQARREVLQAEFRRYMVLAEDNEHIAGRFLITAHPDAAEHVPELQAFFVINSMQQ